MHRFRHLHYSSRRALAALLTGVLLLVQALGLSHGLVHAGIGTNAGPAPHAHGHAAALTNPLERLFGDEADGQHGPHHSCLAYDAACTPSFLHSPAFALVLSENRYCLATWQVFSSWCAPFRLNFSSRAPPQS